MRRLSGDFSFLRLFVALAFEVLKVKPNGCASWDLCCVDYVNRGFVVFFFLVFSWEPNKVSVDIWF